MKTRSNSRITESLAALITLGVAFFAWSGNAAPAIIGVVETGGDNEATDTITAKWTGVTFPVSVANEPVPGAAVGSSYTVLGFGNHAPAFVDRNHRYTNASEVVLIPSYLSGGAYIMSGNDNRDNGGYLLDVTVDQAVTVYLLVDNRLQDADGNSPPTFGPANMQWVVDEGWAAVTTGNNRAADASRPDEVGIDESADGSINQWYSIYRKDFPAGTFQLKQADNTGQNMYGAVVTAAPLPQASIGLNFGADDNGQPLGLGAGDVAGAVPQGNWNNLNGANGSASALVAEVAGVATPTGVTVEWTSPNTWSSTGRGEENNGFAAGEPDAVMMTGYIDTGDSDATKATVTVTGIPVEFSSGGYDVLVYALGGVAGRGGAYTINGETKYGTAPASPTAHAEDPGVDLADTGTYVRFRGQYGSSFTLTASAAAVAGKVNFRAPINGIQIVKNNNPDAGLAYGYVTKDRYDNIGNSVALQDLLNNPKYIAHTPDSTCLRNDFSVNNANECDNCGLVAYGYFIPTASGPHTFYLAADDGAGLFLSTDENPANKVQIASEPLWAGRRNYTDTTITDGGDGRGDPPSNRSVPINLVAGNKYYMEGVVKEAGGGDNLDVAVQGPGDPAVVDGQRAIFGSRIATKADLTGSSLVITQNPVDAKVGEGSPATFTVAADSVSPLCGGERTYQWQKNGVDIAGANGAEYTSGPVTTSDHLSTFRCVVTIPGISRVSTAATLEVLAVGCFPVASASGSGDLIHATVAFGTFLDPATVTDTFNYEIKDAGGNTLNVTGAVIGGDGKSINLTTDPQTEDTLYTVTIIGGVTSIVGGPVCDAPENATTFRSFVNSGPCGGLVFEAFPNIGSTLVSALTSHPSYPNSPAERLVMPSFDTRTVYPDDSHENYGARIRGLFIPPTTGSWRLYLASDDASQLFFNAAGASAAGAVKVQEETGCCNGFAAHTTAPFNLVAGQGYYIEVLYKEGGGGDFARVAAKLANDPTDPNTLAAMPGAWVGYPAAPVGIGGAITITTQPADTTVAENTTATFSVGTSNPNGLPVCYQWKRDGAAIAGATGSSYSLMASLADSGATFSVDVAIIGSAASSAVATLTVVGDVEAPLCVSAAGSRSLRNITVRMNELLLQGSAQDTFNYSITPGLGDVTAAVLNADGTSVTLTTAEAQTPGAEYEVTVQGLTDLANNTMPAPCSVRFKAYVISCGFAVQENYFNIGGGVSVNDLRAAPTYPNSPDLTRYLGTLQINTADEFDNYGARVSGFLIPPVSGAYNFFMSSDDGGEFWLSTDASPANLQLIASEPTWNGRRDWLGTARRNAAAPENRSSTLFPAGIELVAGQMYYFEGLMKEGGGGDNLAATWQLPGEPLPANGSGAIPGVYMATLAEPGAGSIVIDTQPADQSVEENTAASFSVAATATPATGIFYQWYRNDVLIVGANSATYSPTVGLADNGAQYHAVLYVPGATVTSTKATLEVYHRNTAPQFDCGTDVAGVEDSGPVSVPGWARNIAPYSGVPAQVTDILVATDPITLVNGVNDGDGNAGPPPGAEGVEHAIDGVTQKYLNFLDLGSGFSTTPALGSSIVTGIRFYTANDAEPRDPASYLLEGSTAGEAGPWEIIASGPLALPSGRNQGGTIAVDPLVHFHQALQFANTLAYTSYRVTFPTIKDAAAANSMQIAEVELLGVPSGLLATAEAGQMITFEVTANSNPGLFSVQPAVSPSGTLSYTPAANASGSATVTVVAKDDGGTAHGGADTSAPCTFVVTVNPVCDAPVAVSDAATAQAGTPVVIAVLANDSDADGDVLSVSAVTQGAHGSVSTDGTTVTYTPAAGYNGSDSFTYTATDSRCGSSTAQVVVRVEGGTPNTLPVARIVSIELCSGVATNVVISPNGTDADVVLDGHLSTDADGDALTFVWLADLDGDGTKEPLATGVLATNTFALGEYELTLLADDGKGSGTATASLEVISACEATQTVIDKVGEAPVTRKCKRPLVSTLKAACASFEKGDYEAGLNQLRAFSYKVRVEMMAQDPAAALDAMRCTQAIINSLKCD